MLWHAVHFDVWHSGMYANSNQQRSSMVSITFTSATSLFMYSVMTVGHHSAMVHCMSQRLRRGMLSWHAERYTPSSSVIKQHNESEHT